MVNSLFINSCFGVGDFLGVNGLGDGVQLCLGLEVKVLD